MSDHDDADLYLKYLADLYLKYRSELIRFATVSVGASAAEDVLASAIMRRGRGLNPVLWQVVLAGETQLPQKRIARRPQR